jgi:hypothetical protein
MITERRRYSKSFKGKKKLRKKILDCNRKNEQWREAPTSEAELLRRERLLGKKRMMVERERERNVEECGYILAMGRECACLVRARENSLTEFASTLSNRIRFWGLGKYFSLTTLSIYKTPCVRYGVFWKFCLFCTCFVFSYLI